MGHLNLLLSNYCLMMRWRSTYFAFLQSDGHLDYYFFHSKIQSPQYAVLHWSHSFGSKIILWQIVHLKCLSSSSFEQIKSDGLNFSKSYSSSIFAARSTELSWIDAFNLCYLTAPGPRRRAPTNLGGFIWNLFGITNSSTWPPNYCWTLPTNLSNIS